jgi:hypothetical protein
MTSKFIDMPVGPTKVKRAEATLLGRSSSDLAILERRELAECAWALATVLTAAQQGVRLAGEVFTLAESMAFSRNGSPPLGSHPNSVRPAAQDRRPARSARRASQ